MERLVISGGTPLEGTVRVSGAKNGALPLLAATVLSEGRCVLQNVPDLKDIRTLAEILREVGLSVEKTAPNTYVTRLLSEENSVARYELVSQMRASIYLLGPLLAKRGEARVSLPGGCVIGLRPVDLHIKGLRALGAEIELEHGYIVARAPGGRLRGARMFLGGPNGSSVGATANVLMAACLADGKTIIEGAACEPEIGVLARFLNRMGATIEGIDTPRLVITGVPALRGARVTVPPDRIEAGTFMVAAAATGGDVRIEEAPLDHLGAVVAKLREAGVEVLEEDDGLVRVRRQGPLRPVNVTTLTYPGYPTDMQAQLVAMLTLADGISVVSEKIYPDRFMHCAELNRMGAQILKQAASAIVRGVPRLSGADVMASDLRAGAALVIAGLVAEGRTTVHRVYHIDRGYERIEEKFRGLGACIERLRGTPSTTLKRAA
ncbi:MAG: UDP-N-acetylglucosamine 1-carboxyvinyltransferase [Planctomycetota bacterium]|nr:MAG: UDP-N-acetylglucosamine 1-carboxyvinyltransferase [Planctomycetota bacterium]